MSRPVTKLVDHKPGGVESASPACRAYVSKMEDGTPCIVGYRSPELQREIKRLTAETTPMGEHLGMGVRAFSKTDLQFILDQAYLSCGAVLPLVAGEPPFDL